MSFNGARGHDAALQGYTGPGRTWANEINFAIMTLMQDRSLDLLTSSPAHYQCATGALMFMSFTTKNLILRCICQSIPDVENSPIPMQADTVDNAPTLWY